MSRTVKPGVVSDDGGVKIVAAASDHRPVEPSLAFRVEHEGHAVVLAGDTVPCVGLDELCAGADVYVQTVIRPDLVQAIPSVRLQDILDYHSSCEDAGRNAAKAEVGTLVLTHPVPPPAPGTEADWVAQAAAYFDGEVVLAHDLMTITV